MGAPKTLPADFFDKQQGESAPQTLPANFFDNPQSQSVQQPSKPSFWSNPKEYLSQRIQELQQEAQHQTNLAMGPESEGKSVASRLGHRILSLAPETAAVVDKGVQSLMDWKSAAAIGAGAVDPAIPAAYFMAQGAQGVKENAAPIAKGTATPEQVQDALLSASAVAGGAAGGMSPKGGSVYRGVKNPIAGRAPLGDTVVKPRGTVPAESATPLELKQYADANNIPITAAQATEHNLPRNLESVGERATVGGTAVKRQIKAAQAAVVQHAQNLMDGFSPNTQGLADAGSAIKQNVEGALEKQQLQARQNYSAVDKAANGVMVDMTPLKAEAQRLLNDSSFLREKVPSLDAKRASGILKSIVNAPDQATFTQAQDLRSALIDEASHPENAISKQAQAWIKQMSGLSDSQMMQAAKTSPQLEQAFRSANDHWKSLQEDFNNPRSPLNQILMEPDPSKVPQKLMQQGSIGGSPYNVKLLDKYGIDKGALKWSVAGDLLQKDFGLYKGGKVLGGYSDDFLRQLYTPDELSHIYKTGAIARSVKLNVNPSGTAAVEMAASDVQRPVRSMVPKALAAKATLSKNFNDLMMTPPKGKLTPQGYKQWLQSRIGKKSAAGLAIGASTQRDDEQ